MRHFTAHFAALFLIFAALFSFCASTRAQDATTMDEIRALARVSDAAAPSE